MHATYAPAGNRAVVSFERRLRHPVDAVWRAITERDQLRRWFPSTIEGDLEAGAALRFTHEDGIAWEGEVRDVEPPTRLAFMWGEDLLEFELQPLDDGAGCLLSFTATMGESNKAARDAAGWHVCLDRLDSLLGGSDTEPPGAEPTSEWRGHYDAYSARGFPTGAELPAAKSRPKR
jgi:uncharacterized protein YndB with AHSA1/START domain